MAPEPGCRARDTICPVSESRGPRCVLGTGLPGREGTLFALRGPQSAGERGSEKGGRPGVDKTGRVEAGLVASMPLSAWAGPHGARAQEHECGAGWREAGQCAGFLGRPGSLGHVAIPTG